MPIIIAFKLSLTNDLVISDVPFNLNEELVYGVEYVLGITLYYNIQELAF